MTPQENDRSASWAIETALPRLIHEAVVVGGMWGPRCRPRLEWRVPLAQTVDQLTCVDCLDMGKRGVLGE